MQRDDVIGLLMRSSKDADLEIETRPSCHCEKVQVLQSPPNSSGPSHQLNTSLEEKRRAHVGV